MNDLRIENNILTKKLKTINNKYLNVEYTLFLQKILQKKYDKTILNLHFDKNKLISEIKFLDTYKCLDKNNISNEILKQIAIELYKLHKVKFNSKFEYLRAWTFTNLYNFFLNSVKNWKYDFSKYKNFINKSKKLDANLVICHNDLHQNNILINNKNNDLKLIDWDFVNVNNYHYDLSSFISENNLTKKQINYFISQYKNKIDIEVINYYVILEKIIFSMWAYYLYEQTHEQIFYEIYFEKLNLLKKTIF